MNRFESYLKANLPYVESFHPHFNETLKVMLLAGGKRFRPALLLGVVEAYESLLFESALPVALAIEMLHTYSLIHDDLPAMDNADLRRGQQTVHRSFDDASAILAGDALNTEAFLRIAQAPLREDIKIELIRILAQNGGLNGMVLGQAIDCYFEKRALTLEQIRELHKNKTAKLIAASLEMGSVIVQLQRSLKERLYSFGLDLGVLFQIQDDIIDATQSNSEAGKSTGADECKNSFVNTLGLKGAMDEADRVSSELEQKLEQFDKTLQAKLSKIVLPYIRRHKN